MKNKVFAFSVFLTIGSLSLVYAGEKKDYSKIQVPPSAEFDQVKKLAGVWEGTESGTGKEAKSIKVEYKLTSAGSAVVEILMPGTQDEMHSVYFNQNGKLTMTHYCALGNRPILGLEKTDPSGILLNFSPDSGIDVQKEPHMHSLKLSMPDQETLIHEWTYYENGKPAGTTVFNLKRVT